ncbi:MAG: DUF1343 domain-containing protein [Pyrinomonadaceae bacterium]|nr:DUF1343 domain-containing protein [Pyrinomonadaceae bacterium]
MRVKLGIEKLLADHKCLLKGQRVGLICNQASVDHSFDHSADLMFRHPDIDLQTLFGPQHGIRGDVQDNMIETPHSTDADTGLQVYSLYSETREPNADMLENVDTLVFDLQDVGCRVYTFIYTMANAMKGCAKLGKKFIVCDRPNPINGIDIEGSLLIPGHESFVGMYPIPMRHGMTVGELAEMFNREFDIGCDLTVVKMDGWERELFYDETDAPWVMPSPNMPTVDTAVVFPGTVYLEGTQISEGRGTTRPFEIVGAPFVDARSFAENLQKVGLPGVKFRATNFLPTFQKHKGEVCGGVFLHITDRRSFEPVITGLAIIRQLFEDYGDQLKWKIPPYEYEFERNPFDVISGDTETRKMIETGSSVDSLRSSWQQDLKNFDSVRTKYLLY